jgi:hypothetical protein
MRVPGQKFFVPANKKTIAGMARSYKCEVALLGLTGIKGVAGIKAGIKGRIKGVGFGMFFRITQPS